jgi:TusA-related sulfurtransferase
VAENPDVRDNQEASMTDDMKSDEVVDARGMYCPGPLMELIKTIQLKPVGTVLSVLSTDEGSVKDIPAWIQKVGQVHVGTQKKEGYWDVTVKKVK